MNQLLLCLSIGLFGLLLGQARPGPADVPLAYRFQKAVDLYQNGLVSEALLAFAQLYPAAQASGNHDTLLQVLMFRAHGHTIAGEARIAWRLYDSLEAHRATYCPTDIAWQVRSWYLKGQMHNLLGQHLAALETSTTAWTTAQALDSIDHPLLGGIAHTIGMEHVHFGNYQQAFSWLKRAAAHEQATTPPNYPQLNLLYFGISDALEALGDVGKAVRYLGEAERLVRQRGEIPDDMLATIFIQRGDLAYDAGRYEEALAAYQRARQTFQQHEGSFFAQDSLHAINGTGTVLYRLQRYEMSAAVFQRLLTVAYRDTPEIIHVAAPVWMVNLANSLAGLGRFAQAEQVLRQAQHYQDHYLSLPVVYEQRGSVWKSLSETYMSQEKWAQAHRAAQQALFAFGARVDTQDLHALPTSLPYEAGWHLLEALFIKALTYANQHAQSQQVTDLQRAIALMHLADSTTRLIQRNLQSAEGKHALVRRMVRFYELGIRLSLRQQDVAGAFAWAERANSRLLRLALQASRLETTADAPPALLQREQAVRQQLQAIRQQMETLPIGTARRDSLQARLFARQQALEACQLRLTREAPLYHQLRYQDPPLDLANIQAELRRTDSWCLRYFWGDRRLHIFGLDGRQISHRVLPISQIGPRLDTLLGHLHDGQAAAEKGYQPQRRAAFARLASQLGADLLSPFAQRDWPKGLRIIPDGPLAYLPFEVLLVHAPQPGAGASYADLPYLFDQVNLRYGYSASPEALPRQGPHGRGYLGVAPRYQGPWPTASRRTLAVQQLGPLHNNIPEVEAVARLMRGQALTADEASETRFKDRASRYGVLHLSTHTLYNDRNPMYSGLLFGQPDQVYHYVDTAEEDGVLHAYEIYDLDLRAELAVLSACQTGSGAYQRGEGVASLARAFHYAGCPNVVMSLWPVDDLATKELMVRFFEALQQGLPKDQALRRARTQFLATSPQQHPHYWAGFVLMGDDQPLATSRRARGGWWVAVGLVALLLVAGAVTWRTRHRPHV